LILFVAIQCDDGGASNSADVVCYAGDQCTLSLIAPAAEPNAICVGHVLCRPDHDPLIAADRFLVRVILFDINIPLLRGSRYELHAHSLREPCIVTRLCAVVDKATGEIVRRNPR
jgi:elongation factor 1 alpha-like protein